MVSARSPPAVGASLRRPKPSPSPKPRRRTARKPPSPIKSLAASLRTCRRRLVKIFSRLAVIGTPERAKRGFHRLKPLSFDIDDDLQHSPLLGCKPSSAALPPPADESKKTLFLDLDETLIHSQTAKPERYDFVVRPVIGGQRVVFYVLKRPGVDDLLRAAAAAFEVVVFTAGLEAYASLVLDQLDPTGELIAHRLYRTACRETEGKLVKDLAATGREMRRAVIVDDNPNAYALQPENAVPIRPFVDDPNDGELKKLARLFDVAAGFDDMREAVRHFLSSSSNGDQEHEISGSS